MEKKERKLIISFSGRKNGNCDRIASYIATENDKTVHFGDLNIHPCSACDYQCFSGECPYREDDVYRLYAEMPQYDKIIFIVPIYCGNPSSLYFMFNERGQDYFSHNDIYDALVEKLYIIGIYGNRELAPDFIPSLEKWFEGTNYKNRVFGIERHLYGQKLTDYILEVPEVRERLDVWLTSLGEAEHRKDGEAVDEGA